MVDINDLENQRKLPVRPPTRHLHLAQYCDGVSTKTLQAEFRHQQFGIVRSSQFLETAQANQAGICPGVQFTEHSFPRVVEFQVQFSKNATAVLRIVVDLANLALLCGLFGRFIHTGRCDSLRLPTLRASFADYFEVIFAFTAVATFAKRRACSLCELVRASAELAAQRLLLVVSSPSVDLVDFWRWQETSQFLGSFSCDLLCTAQIDGFLEGLCPKLSASLCAGATTCWM